MKKYTLAKLLDEKSRIAIHLPTQKEANELSRAFHRLGMKWQNGISYLNQNYWNRYENKTCYRSSGRMYGRLQGYYEDGSYEIVEYNDVRRLFFNCEFHMQEIDI